MNKGGSTRAKGQEDPNVTVETLLSPIPINIDLFKDVWPWLVCSVD